MGLTRTSAALSALLAMACMPMAALADGPDELRQASPTAAPAAPAAAPATPTPAATPQAAPAPAPAPAATAMGRSGAIALPSGSLTLNVPTSFLFHGPDVARGYLTRAGAALPSGEVLGLLAPRDSTPDSPNFWGGVVTFQPIGYVAADTAAGLSAGGFVRSVRDARTAAGRPFVGFETNPIYTPATTAVGWVERSAQASPTARTVRHEQRLLGRQGVAGVVIPARENQLSEVKASAPSMLAMMAFEPGQKHGDFTPGGDTTSSFTIPDLVTNTPTAGPVAEAAGAGGGASAQTASAGGSSGGQTNYLPWLLGGLALIGGLGWLALGNRSRRDDDLDYKEDDPNIQPKKD